MDRIGGRITVALLAALAVVGTVVALVVPPSTSIEMTFFLNHWESVIDISSEEDMALFCWSWSNDPTVLAGTVESGTPVERESLYIFFNEFCDEDHDFPG